MVIFDKNHPLYNPFYGIHHVYINRKSLKIIKLIDNRVFLDGSKIAIVFYDHEEAKGSFIEGKKRIEAFMINTEIQMVRDNQRAF